MHGMATHDRESGFDGDLKEFRKWMEGVEKSAGVAFIARIALPFSDDEQPSVISEPEIGDATLLHVCGLALLLSKGMGAQRPFDLKGAARGFGIDGPSGDLESKLSQLGVEKVLVAPSVDRRAAFLIGQSSQSPELADHHLNGISELAKLRRRSTRHLTEREAELLQMAKEGLTEKECAGHLGISPMTVRVHFQNAKGKLGALNKCHAVALAMREGYVTP